MNGGPAFSFTPAVSLFVHCASQDEIDTLWSALGAGGQPQRCGWLTDRYGVSWQIVPSVLAGWLNDPDAAKAARVMTALLEMDKLDIARLQQAATA